MTATANWIQDFLGAGPEYPAQRMSLAETQGLLLKAGRGADLPLGHAQDLSALAEFLLSDPRLLAMAAAALESPRAVPVIEGTRDHRVIEGTSVVMIGPVLVDLLVAGSRRVVLHDLDWPLLIWAYLAQAERVYDLRFDLNFPSATGAIASLAETSRLQSSGPVQPASLEVLDRLERLAAKTFVPESDLSRMQGAGAGLTDND